MDKRNPEKSTYLQMILDLKDLGMGNLTLDQLAVKLQNDRSLRSNLDKQFLARAYNEDRITFAQLAIQPGLMTLDSTAVKLLLLMSMYATQDGLVSIKLETIKEILQISLKTARAARDALKSTGMITEVAGAMRHEAQIYAVNPDILHKGPRRHLRTHRAAYYQAMPITAATGQIHDDELTVTRAKTILDQDILPGMEIKQTIMTRPVGETKVRYGRIDFVKKEPTVAAVDPVKDDKINPDLDLDNDITDDARLTRDELTLFDNPDLLKFDTPNDLDLPKIDTPKNLDPPKNDTPNNTNQLPGQMTIYDFEGGIT